MTGYRNKSEIHKINISNCLTASP